MCHFYRHLTFGAQNEEMFGAHWIMLCNAWIRQMSEPFTTDLLFFYSLIKFRGKKLKKILANSEFMQTVVISKARISYDKLIRAFWLFKQKMFPALGGMARLKANHNMLNTVRTLISHQSVLLKDTPVRKCFLCLPFKGGKQMLIVQTRRKDPNQ